MVQHLKSTCADQYQAELVFLVSPGFFFQLLLKTETNE